MKEIWKDIKDYEGLYQVSNWGRIKRLRRLITNQYNSFYIEEKILKPQKNRYGYLYINLYKNGIMKHKTIHKLVAEVFLPNPNNLPQINHKDEDKTNNHVNNLEWCDRKYNINYGTRNERISKSQINGKRSKIVIQYNLDGTFVREWPSAMECERNGFEHSLIIYCCQGKRKTHKGFKWSYSLYSESKTNSD